MTVGATCWIMMLSTVGRCANEVKTSVSAASEAAPVAVSPAPPVSAVLLQPRPGPVAGFPHGQAMTPATAGSQKKIGGTGPGV